jgi:hypothetical protein
MTREEFAASLPGFDPRTDIILPCSCDAADPQLHWARIPNTPQQIAWHFEIEKNRAKLLGKASADIRAFNEKWCAVYPDYP